MMHFSGVPCPLPAQHAANAAAAGQFSYFEESWFPILKNPDFLSRTVDLMIKQFPRMLTNLMGAFLHLKSSFWNDFPVKMKIFLLKNDDCIAHEMMI